MFIKIDFHSFIHFHPKEVVSNRKLTIKSITNQQHKKPLYGLNSIKIDLHAQQQGTYVNGSIKNSESAKNQTASKTCVLRNGVFLNNVMSLIKAILSGIFHITIVNSTVSDT